MEAVRALLILLERLDGRDVCARWRQRSAKVRRHGSLRCGNDAVIVCGIEVDEAHRSLGMRAGEGGELVAAERMPDEHRACDPQRVEDRADLRDARCQIVAVPVRLPGFSEADAREADDAEAIGESGRKIVEYMRGVP